MRPWTLTTRTFLSALFLALFACSSFNQKEPVAYRQYVAVFRLDGAIYPEGDLATVVPPTGQWDELSPECLRALLGNLEFRREHVWGPITGRVFYRGQLEEVVRVVGEAQSSIPAGYRMVVVSRFDPDRSVLSRMDRTTLMLWRDENGINVVFGEIKDQFPQNQFDPSVADDWTEVLPINVGQAPADLRLLPSEDFEYKLVAGRTHYTWAIFDPARVASLEFRPPGASESDAAAESAEQSTEHTDLTSRLRELSEALEAGLITREEYEAQRQRILEQH